MILASILIAIVVSGIGPIAKRWASGIEIRSRWTKFIGWCALFGIIVPGLLLTLFTTKDSVGAFAKPMQDMMTAVKIIDERDPERVVILNTPNYFLTLYTSAYIEYLGGVEREVRLLSAASGVFTIEKIDESVIVLRDDREGWLNNFVARVIRVHEDFEVGKVYEKDHFSAKVLETTEDGKDVLSVEFEFVIPLDDPGWLFLSWNGDEFVEFDVAGLTMGDEVFLADTSDILKTAH